MAYDNQAAKNQLLEILNARRQALLLVGSGSSRFVDYPSWSTLVDNLRQAVVPERAFPDGLGLLQQASFVRRTLQEFANSADRQRLYRDFLEHTFRPRANGPTHANLHRTLVQLPFCGVATTNYDPVLDSALSAVRVNAGLHPCHAIDACANHRHHHVFHFLRSLSSDGPLSSVLHLHGYWENANDLILTYENYTERYGLSSPGAPAADSLARPLDTFHRKVVWALLTMRPVVFVGFSVDDPAFQLMLSFVHEDFELSPRPPAHIAILPSDPNDDHQQERDAERLGAFGVLPVFFAVTIDAAGTQGYEALPALIEELASTIGSPTGPPDLGSISRRLLAR